MKHTWILQHTTCVKQKTKPFWCRFYQTFEAVCDTLDVPCHMSHAGHQGSEWICPRRGTWNSNVPTLAFSLTRCVASLTGSSTICLKPHSSGELDFLCLSWYKLQIRKTWEFSRVFVPWKRLQQKENYFPSWGREHSGPCLFCFLSFTFCMWFTPWEFRSRILRAGTAHIQRFGLWK